MKTKTTIGFLLVSLVVLVAACGPSTPTPVVRVIDLDETIALCPLHVQVTVNAVDVVANVDTLLVGKLNRYDTNNFYWTLTETETKMFRAEFITNENLNKFNEIIQRSGYSLLISLTYPDLLYTYLSSLKDQSYIPVSEAETSCPNEGITIQMPLQIIGIQGWTLDIASNKLLFDDGKSRAELDAPYLVSIQQAIEDTYFEYPEATWLEGNPANMSGYSGTFHIEYGSPRASDLSEFLHNINAEVVYDSDPNGITFGVIYQDGPMFP